MIVMVRIRRVAVAVALSLILAVAFIETPSATSFSETNISLGVGDSVIADTEDNSLPLGRMMLNYINITKQIHS